MPSPTKKRKEKKKTKQLSTQLFAQIKKKKVQLWKFNLQIKAKFLLSITMEACRGNITEQKYLSIKKSESATFHSMSRWVNKIALEKNFEGRWFKRFSQTNACLL